MIETGIIIALGLLMLMSRLPWKWKLWMVSNALIIDIAIFVGLMFLHAGTHAGVMGATAGALFASLTLAVVKKFIGHISGGRYYPGWFNMKDKL